MILLRQEQLSKAKEGAKIIDVEDPEREENETKVRARFLSLHS